MTVFEQRTHELVQSACRKISKVTLRDLFAMNVINGILAGGDICNGIPYDDLCISAYEIADSILKAREKK